MYQIGRDLIEFPNLIMEKIRHWNKYPLNEDASYDERVIHSLLNHCVTENELAKFQVDENTMAFLHGTQLLFLVHLHDFLKKKNSFISRYIKGAHEQQRRAYEIVESLQRQHV